MCHGLGGFYSQVGVADRPEDVKHAFHAPLLFIVHGISGLEQFSARNTNSRLEASKTFLFFLLRLFLLPEHEFLSPYHPCSEKIKDFAD